MKRNGNMIEREMAAELALVASEYPVVTLIGPRQAGKTTLVKNALPGYSYSNLEHPDTRRFATDDPNGYISSLKTPVIIDEIQRVPELLSYIQVIVDDNDKCGEFVLTGSHQLHLQEAISQSLAGRTAVLNLMPLSISELANAGITFERFEEYCFSGFLPRVHARRIRPGTFYANYYKTYVERDVRLLVNLKNASLFEKTLHLLAGRVGQIMDHTSLSNDVGVDQKTIKNWLSILESSFIVYKLRPFYSNFGKRVIKSPKYYFTDTGLLSFLLGIRNPHQVARDPLVGALFENMIVMECLKQRYNRGLPPDFYFFRDSHGNEIDLILPEGNTLTALEIKSAATYNAKTLDSLKKFKNMADMEVRPYLVYSGETFDSVRSTTVLNFKNVHRVFNRDPR